MHFPIYCINSFNIPIVCSYEGKLSYGNETGREIKVKNYHDDRLQMNKTHIMW